MHASPTRYSRSMMIMHWLTLLLIIVAYASIEGRELFSKGTPERDFMKWLHFNIGLSILLLVILRLAVRFKSRVPAPVPGPAWQRFAATGVHGLLYLFLLGMPLAGWAIISAEGHVPSIWGIDLPMLLQQNKALAHNIEELHETAGSLGYFLIGLHAAAAIWHQYCLKDGVMSRMLPEKS